MSIQRKYNTGAVTYSLVQDKPNTYVRHSQLKPGAAVMEKRTCWLETFWSTTPGQGQGKETDFFKKKEPKRTLTDKHHNQNHSDLE